GLQVHRVVRLREGIEELVNGDRLSRFVTHLEIAALEHLRHVVARRKTHPAVASERLEPLAVETRDGLLRIEDLEDLRLVCLRVCRNLLHRQRRARLRAAGWIPNERGERTNDVDDGMTEILEV